MAPPERPGVVWGSAASGGLFGGTAVGIAEALYVLSATTPSEYQALVYAAVLYGALGLAAGAVLGAVLAVVALRARVSLALAWSGAFCAVGAGIGGPLLAHIVSRRVYDEQGLPPPEQAFLVVALLLASVIGGWLLVTVLVKTPLRVLPRLKATLVAWTGIVLLARMFSLAPAPGAAMELAPHRPQPPEAATRPDVIVVMVDSLRADALGAYGAGAGATPALDALAADGVVFEQAVSASGWTRPATASMFTSLLPSSHACTTKESSLSPLVDTLAEAMQRSGYATGGLPDNPNVTAARGFGQGFDYYPYTQEFPLGAQESTHGIALYAALRRALSTVDRERRVEDYYAPAETQLEHAWRYVEAQDGDRFFLFVHLMDPHDPYFAHPADGAAVGRADGPSPEPEAAMEARYRGEVAHLDEALGVFVDHLRASGRYDRTLLVVTADHGEELGDHGGWWHGASLYDELVHIPLLVKLPGQARAGTRVPWQVRAIDLAPTIAELANVAGSARWRGVPLIGDDFDRLLALSPPADAAAPGWATHPASREAISELDLDGWRIASLRAGGRKVIITRRSPPDPRRALPPVALYDLIADPGEERDLADGTAEAPLRAWLDRQLEEARADAVVALGEDLSELDRARLEALGYLPAADAE